MTPQFLRAEAARFREMAEVSEREASRQRLLAMAADYEARAKVADATQPPEPMREAAPEPESDDVVAAKEVRPAAGERRLRSARTMTLRPTSGTTGC